MGGGGNGSVSCSHSRNQTGRTDRSHRCVAAAPGNNLVDCISRLNINGKLLCASGCKRGRCRSNGHTGYRHVLLAHIDPVNIGQTSGSQCSETDRVCPDSQQKPFVDLVDQLLSLTYSNNYFNDMDQQRQVRTLELEIDRLVFELYELTDEEISAIMSFNN